MKKLKSNKGFTFIEMLACVVTMLLIAMICSVGLDMASKSYRESVFESNCQMLESTVDMQVGDILRFATSVQTDGDGNVTAFTNKTYRIDKGRIEVPARSGDTGGYFLVYLETDAENGYMILNQSAYADSMYIENFTLTYDDSTGMFSGNYTIKSTQLGGLKRDCTYAYRTAVNY